MNYNIDIRNNIQVYRDSYEGLEYFFIPLYHHGKQGYYVFFDPWLAITKIGVDRYVSAFGYSDFSTKTEVLAKHQLQSMVKVDNLLLDNDFVHTDGIWLANVANVNTKELKIEATKDELKTHTITKGFSLTCLPNSILVSAAGAIPAVQITNSEWYQQFVVFNPTGFSFNRGQITIDNVLLRGGSLNGRDLDVQIRQNFLVEY